MIDRDWRSARVAGYRLCVWPQSLQRDLWNADLRVGTRCVYRVGLLDGIDAEDHEKVNGKSSNCKLDYGIFLDIYLCGIC